MRIGLTGLARSGKSTVFSALTGIDAGAGHRRGREGASIGTVKVPDSRVDALALIYRPRKVVYAELSFTDLGGDRASGLDRGTLHAMRDMDALCHVLRAFAGTAAGAPDPAGELETLETEALLADLEVIEQRIERLRKEGRKTSELALLNRVGDALESESALRDIGLDAMERKTLSGYRPAHSETSPGGAQRRGGRHWPATSTRSPLGSGRARRRGRHPVRARRDGHCADGRA